MFIIDFRNKNVSEYRFSVMGNSNVDIVNFVSHFTQYATDCSIYLKVRSNDDDYVDKIEIANQNISIDEDALVCKWKMGAVSTQCKKLYLQLQFEKEGDIIAQTGIVGLTLADTINVEKLIPPIYPEILKRLQEQIDDLKADSYAGASMTYENDTLSMTFKNKDDETLTSFQFAIPTSDRFRLLSSQGLTIEHAPHDFAMYWSVGQKLYFVQWTIMRIGINITYIVDIFDYKSRWHYETRDKTTTFASIITDENKVYDNLPIINGDTYDLMCIDLPPYCLLNGQLCINNKSNQTMTIYEPHRLTYGGYQDYSHVEDYLENAEHYDYVNKIKLNGNTIGAEQDLYEFNVVDIGYLLPNIQNVSRSTKFINNIDRDCIFFINGEKYVCKSWQENNEYHIHISTSQGYYEYVGAVDFNTTLNDILTNATFIEYASKDYVNSEIATIKRNSFIDVDTATYPTLNDFLASTGEEGYIYLYPIDTSDLSKGYHQYIWESSAWRSIGDTQLDLSGYYTKSEIEAKYYSTENVSNLSTMGELRAFVENINNQGKHCLFDLHSYIADAYVCVIHCWSSGGKNYCFVQDLVNHKTYGNYSGYADSTTIASYFSSNAMDNIKVIKITDENITMAQISTLLQESNTLGDYVMFDVSAITTAMYLATIYMNGSYYRVFDTITGRTASGTSTSGLTETLLSVIEGGVSKPTTWEEIHNLIVEGNGSLVYSAGDELDVKFFNSFVATTDDTGITIDVDRDTFVMKTDMATANYEFVYNSNRSTWVLNENDVDITEYGITITGTPTNDKKITIAIVVDSVPYIVMGNDQETSANNDFTHSLTLRRKYARTSGLVFDEKEAFFYNGTNAPLQAGTYHFLLGNHSWYSADIGKYFQFTLTQDLPVGGQLVWQQAYNATLANANIKVFANALTTAETETCVMTEGQGGTYLGVINNGKPDSTTTGYNATYNQYLNQCQRALLGNNDDEQSNNRQWLNSDKAKGTYAQAQNGWDRIATYVLSGSNGFLYDLDPHLRQYLGACSKITESVVFTTTGATSGGRKTTTEKVWKLSREEIQSCSQSEAQTYPPYTYYHNLLGSTYGDWRTDTRFILTNESGTAQYVFLRSPYTGGGSYVRNIYTSGRVSSGSASGGDCRVECFAIV